MTVNGCTGECCREFPLSMGIGMLMALAAAPDANPELVQIAGMVIPVDSPGRVFSTPTYSCRHWDSDTGACGIYESRPRMCSDFPYEHMSCHICGGTYSRAADECGWGEYTIPVTEPAALVEAA